MMSESKGYTFGLPGYTLVTPKCVTFAVLYIGRNDQELDALRFDLFPESGVWRDDPPLGTGCIGLVHPYLANDLAQRGYGRLDLEVAALRKPCNRAAVLNQDWRIGALSERFFSGAVA